ncbi:queuosine transporter QueT, partial [Streptococcus agalactiae]|nr:queuosine transporter QueT [Streptococcus agalactiae]
FVGGGSTLLFVYLGTILFKQYQKDYLFNGLINKAFFFFSFFFAASMITVAVELKIVAGLPLLLTWLTTAVGELASLLVGAVLVDKLSRHVDFTK